MLRVFCAGSLTPFDGQAVDESRSAQDAYRLDGDFRHQVEGHTDGSSVTAAHSPGAVSADAAP